MTTFLKVKEDYIKKVSKRIECLIKDKNSKYRTQTSLYNKNERDKCPNNRIYPYVACLIINQKI
ncbi:MAG: hypothetical protein ACOVOQ_02330 [Flavobacterium sp.]